MQRIRQLDGVRALAILMVFFHHALGAKLMWMGVDLFFILSGFLITGILLNARQESLRSYFAHFYSRRARRILPPYVLTLLIASLFFGFAWAQHWYLYILLTNLLGPLQIPHPKAFGPLWSLAVEEQFYLAWPFAVYFLSERRLAQLAVGLVGLAPVLRAVAHFPDYTGVYNLPFFRMDLLALGALLCLVYRRRQSQIESQGAKFGLLFTVLGLVGLLMLARCGVMTTANTRIGNVWIFECSLCACFGIILWALSGRHAGILKSTPLVYLGRISYSMYLVHVGVLEVASGLHLARLETAAIALATIVGYSSLSWFLMEKPMLTGMTWSRPRFLPQRTRRAAA